jgi:hypothetical protein
MTFNDDQDTNRQRSMQPGRKDATSSNKTMLWVVGAAALVLIAGFMFFFPTSDRLKLVQSPSTATAPASTGSSSTKLTHPGGDEPRTPAAVEPATPTPTPAPMAPKTPPSR